MTFTTATELVKGAAYRFTCKRKGSPHEFVWEGRYVGVGSGYATDGPRIVITPLSTGGPVSVRIPPSFVREVEELS